MAIGPLTLRWFVDNPGIFLWVEDSKIVGFSAADPPKWQHF